VLKSCFVILEAAPIFWLLGEIVVRHSMEGMNNMEDVKKDDNEENLQDFDIDFYRDLVDGLIRIYESISNKTTE
jgi:hypothetical protein